MKLKFTLLTALAGLFALNASAQDAPKPPDGGRPDGGRGRFQPSPEVLKEFDKDGDGKLNEEEAKAARESRMKKMLEKYDADKDGKLNDEERKKMEAENPRRGPGGPGGGRWQPDAETIKKFDKDGDGKLNEEEMKALRDAREKEWLEKYDTDKDGKLSDEERRKGFDDMRKQREAARAAAGDKKPEDKKPEGDKK